MLRKFDKRILRFPVKWANAVTDWLLGLCSDGSITINNSASPSNGVPRIAVNASWVSNLIAGVYDRDRPSPAALAATADAHLAPSDECPAKKSDAWSLGVHTPADSSATDPSSSVARTGCTFDVVTRSQRVDLVDYLYFRTVTVSPLGVIVAVSAENKCVAVIDTTYQ